MQPTEPSRLGADVVAPGRWPERSGDWPASAARVQVLVSANAAYLQHVAVCLTSLLVNNPDSAFDLVVVGRTMETLDEDRLRRSLAFSSSHTLRFCQFTPPADRLLPLNPQAHYSLDIWTRLWVHEFFPADVKRVLY